MKKRIPKIKSIEKLESVRLSQTTVLRRVVWAIRRQIRLITQTDIFRMDENASIPKKVLKKVYKTADTALTILFPSLIHTTPKPMAVKQVADMLRELDYTIIDSDTKRPWGAFFRLSGTQVDRFIHDFFPGLSLIEAKLGRDEAELSPKILLVSPGQRLSWQYHDRRAERWRFLNDGHYYRSHSDNEGKAIIATSGDVVQFDAGERHRLGANRDGTSYTLVAEIWQHTVHNKPSNEADIVRLSDDYDR